MIFKGFKFGLLLQFAIGPVCLFVFQTAATSGLGHALLAVAGVALIDSLFIFLAIKGAASVINTKKAQAILKIFGALILITFGLSTILSQFGINFLPSLSLSASGGSPFTHALLITAANPLTIIFWAGVFSAKIIEDSMDKKEIYLFGLGAVLSTVIFLSAISVLGSLTTNFLPSTVIQILNVAVGSLLIYYGIKFMLKKQNN